MLTNQEVEAMYRAYGKKAVMENIESRKQKRKIYDSEEGREELAELIVKSGVFSSLDPENKAAIGAHNLAIGILDRLGFFDQANLPRLIGYMLTLPIFPELEWMAEGVEGDTDGR